jgi:hypothetical protein
VGDVAIGARIAPRWAMRTSLLRSAAVAVLGIALGCEPGGKQDDVGAIGLALQVVPGVTLNSVSYAISGPAGFTRSGTLDTSQATTVSGVIGSLPAGAGFSISLTSTATDGTTQCTGSAPFSVTAHATTGVTVHLLCHEAPKTGGVAVSGTINICPTVDGVAASPAEALVGGTIALGGAAHDTDGAPAALTYHWTASTGTLSDPTAQSPTFTCTVAGAVTVTLTVSDGDCGDTLAAVVTCTGVAHVVINEVESNGDPVGDWTELYNAGTATADISGWKFKDNDDTHAFYIIPTGTVVPPGGFYVMNVAQFGFGLGAPDMARLWDAAGNPVDSFSWTTHAAGTYGRCPDGTGSFVDMTPSKGAPNVCGTGADAAAGTGGTGADAAAGTGGTGADAAAGAGGTGGAAGTGTDGAAGSTSQVVINEVESNGDPVGDWTELFNKGPTSLDISGWKFKDNDDTHAFYVLPAGTVIPAGGFYVMTVAQFSFGLGAPDMARLFDPAGNLVDSFSWTTHAVGTYGRCPDGTGAFVDMTPSQGAANNCGGGAGGAGGAGGGAAGAGGAAGSGGAGGLAGNEFPWPGTDDVVTVDELNFFGTNLSGLNYQPAAGVDPAVLWAIQNGPSKLYRLLWNGVTWSADATNDWTVGKLLHYTDGTGAPDSEGLSKAEWTDNGIYVSTERDNNNNGVSRLSILRFDTTAAGAELTALNDWNVTADLPVAGPNLGLEAITYVPDTALVAGGFFDEATHAAYDPNNYPNHGTGLFFVGLEANGSVYGYALNHATNGFQRVATFASGQVSIMDLAYDREVGNLWGYCDNTCGNKATVFRLDVTPASPTVGTFQIGRVFDHPSTLPNSNNEGITFAPEAECVGGQKSFFWTDDDAINGHSIRRGTIPCGTFF